MDIIKQIKNESEFQLNNFNLSDIQYLTNIILSTFNKNNIYFSGIGKSLNIAQHTCNILNSININSFILNPINCIHGDLGSIKENDLIILYSKSGNTQELINIIPYLKNKKCKIIGICNDLNSKFNLLCHEVFNLPFQKELEINNINCIPTNSYMSFLYFTNILSSFLIKNSKLTLENYKINHPSGSIGNNLKKIKDVLILDYPKLLYNENLKLIEISLEMTKFKIGCCFFINKFNELIGIITDGDIRRLLLKNNNINNIENYINKHFYFETDLNKYLKDCKKKGFFPILKNNKIIGIVKY